MDNDRTVQMNRQDDVESLMSAVRNLVAQRDREEVDRLVLRSDYRIAERPQGPASANAADAPGRRPVLPGAGRLTRIASAEIEGHAPKPAPRRGLAKALSGGAAPARRNSKPALAALRAAVREVLRDELRGDGANALREEIQRLLREELARAPDRSARS